MGIWDDVWTAARTLRQARGFFVTAAGTLAFGIGLCLLALAVAQAYLLRGLPYPAADRLYTVTYGLPDQPFQRDLETLPWDTLEDIVEHPLAWDLDMFYVLGGAYPESLQGTWVTPGFMAGLGVTPAIGRTFAQDDFHGGGPHPALISHRVWRTRWAGDPAVLGRSFEAYVSDRPEEAETFVVVGVLPERFWHLNAYTDVLVPLAAPTFPYYLRLRPGVSADTAAARITQLVRNGGLGAPSDFEARLDLVHARYVAPTRPAIVAVSWAAGLVLLIACANTSLLVLLRTARRRRELAVRLALGATGTRLARLFVTEAVLVTATAVVVALVAAAVSLTALGPHIEAHLGRAVPGGVSTMLIDGTVVAAALGAGVLVATLLAIVPLLLMRRQTAHAGLTTRGASDGPGVRRTRTLLIATEVAVSLTLLSGSLLMVQSARGMLALDFGYDATGIQAYPLALRQQSYPDAAAQAAYFVRVEERLRAQWPSVALSVGWPMNQPVLWDVEAAADGRRALAGVTAVSASYFATLDVPVLLGRNFTDEDRPGGMPVALLSATAAARLSPDGAVGRTVRLLPGATAAPPSEYTVVGVVGDVRQGHRDDVLADVYLPLSQRGGRFTQLYVRDTSGTPRTDAAIRAALAEIDPEAALASPRSLEREVQVERARPRFLAGLLAAFATFAAALALIGLYGVIAYAVRQREREMAVRMAVGARPAAVVALFVRAGALAIAAGLGAGVWGATMMGRLLERELYGVGPTEPALLGLTAAVFAAAALAAVWWPAKRAARVEITTLLRDA
ncbi:MAG: ABC transporter permease [Vicinamibacterales bacterium]|nr:ABC transporter permease [Vicinamibacterales bacterium]